MTIIKLDPLNKELNITKNDQLTFSYREHVSVGYTADFEIENNLVLEHTETETEYKHPERMKEGMTGGDSARTTFKFKALMKGTTLLIIRKYFRFELEAEYTFRINIS
jgi:hypothetical protein